MVCSNNNPLVSYYTQGIDTENYYDNSTRQMVQDFGYVNLTSLLTPHIIWNSSLFPFYVLTFADLGEVEDEIFKKRRDDDVCFWIFLFSWGSFKYITYSCTKSSHVLTQYFIKLEWRQPCQNYATFWTHLCVSSRD